MHVSFNMSFTDSVEFQMSFDRRNGKPVAVYIVKMDDRIIVKNGMYYVGVGVRS